MSFHEGNRNFQIDPLIFHEMHIFVGFVFKEDDKLYPELFLDKILCIKNEIQCKQNAY